jgi:hypothetical protein
VIAEPLTASPSGERKCLCVKLHNPTPRELHRHHVWPLAEGGPDMPGNLRWLCPSQHSNVHRLWREYQKARAMPDWEILRQYNRYARAIVAEGWAQARAARHPQTLPHPVEKETP